MPNVTLQSIADRVGVSRMTVSNAFSRPDQLSPELRQRILAAADELGYAGPDPAARSLARGTTGAVGVLWSDNLRTSFSDEVSAGFLGAVADELAPTGLALTLLVSGARDDVVPARDVAMDGALAYSCDPQSPALGWLRRRKLPLVYVDLPSPGDASSVTMDDEGGARKAAEHVLSLGHRRVGIITVGLGPLVRVVDRRQASATSGAGAYVAAQRLAGWSEALLAAGVEPVIIAQPSLQADARPAARALLQIEPRPTAVLCFSDTIARDVVTQAHDLGLSVPDDVSVAGFDDAPFAARLRPALTTVHQDLDAKGRAAVAALREAIERRRRNIPVAGARIALPTRLVVRESTGPAPRRPR